MTKLTDDDFDMEYSNTISEPSKLIISCINPEEQLQQILKWQRESNYYNTQKEKIDHLKDEIEYLKTNSTNDSKKLHDFKKIYLKCYNAEIEYPEFLNGVQSIFNEESEKKQ